MLSCGLLDGDRCQAPSRSEWAKKLLKLKRPSKRWAPAVCEYTRPHYLCNYGLPCTRHGWPGNEGIHTADLSTAITARDDMSTVISSTGDQGMREYSARHVHIQIDCHTVTRGSAISFHIRPLFFDHWHSHFYCFSPSKFFTAITFDLTISYPKHNNCSKKVRHVSTSGDNEFCLQISRCITWTVQKLSFWSAAFGCWMLSCGVSKKASQAEKTEQKVSSSYLFQLILILTIH